MPVASTWSQRAVYSSTAASPRARTSARMAATVDANAALASADQCRRAWNAASKPPSVVARRRGLAVAVMASALVDSACEDVDELADRLLLELERGLVDDQPRTDIHDAL